MERLYTAFVSSTYKDLIKERELVAKYLLNSGCVPLGMEYFPSIGASQWELIVESIRAADFCVFIIAGRYGSIDPSTGVSWTERELQEAQRQEKPFVVLMRADTRGLPADNGTEGVGKQRRLALLRDALVQFTPRYYSSDEELASGVYASVAALKESGRLQGWVRDQGGALQPAIELPRGDRRYHFIETRSIYARSSDREDTLDLTNYGRRVIEGLSPRGVTHIAFDYTRDSDVRLQFGPDNTPSIDLLSLTREHGTGGLRRPRKSTGSTFAQDLALNPPLSRGEIMDVLIRAQLPHFKLAFAEDQLQATRNSPLGPRTWDYAGRRIVYPTDRLLVGVFLPDELGVRPLGPKVGLDGSIDDELSNELVAAGAYTTRRDEVEGMSGTYLELDVSQPLLHHAYRVAWELPERSA